MGRSKRKTRQLEEERTIKRYFLQGSYIASELKPVLERAQIDGVIVSFNLHQWHTVFSDWKDGRETTCSFRGRPSKELDAIVELVSTTLRLGVVWDRKTNRWVGNKGK